MPRYRFVVYSSPYSKQGCATPSAQIRSKFLDPERSSRIILLRLSRPPLAATDPSGATRPRHGLTQSSSTSEKNSTHAPPRGTETNRLHGSWPSFPLKRTGRARRRWGNPRESTGRVSRARAAVARGGATGGLAPAGRLSRPRQGGRRWWQSKGDGLRGGAAVGAGGGSSSGQ
jgi:hypothetical protein